jgi:hypothetical protein
LNVFSVEIEPLASYSGSISCATLGDVFRYLVKFPDGLLHDPGVFVTAVPFWRLADPLRVGNGRLLRILAVDTRIDHTLLAAGIHGVFTVEVVR